MHKYTSAWVAIAVVAIVLAMLILGRSTIRRANEKARRRDRQATYVSEFMSGAWRNAHATSWIMPVPRTNEAWTYSCRPYLGTDLWPEVCDAWIKGNGQIVRGSLEQCKTLFIERSPSVPDEEILKTALTVLDKRLAVRGGLLSIVAFGNVTADFPRTMDALAKRVVSHPNLKTLWAKNALQKNNRLAPLPLGPKWQWHTTDLFGEDKSRWIEVLARWTTSPEQTARLHTRKHRPIPLLLTNTSTTSHRSRAGSLQKVREAFLGNPSLVLGEKASFQDYLSQIAGAKFVLSPRGRGRDCHRHWECLLLGTVPIITKDSASSVPSDLPVWWVDDFAEVTPAALEEKTRFFFEKPSAAWNWEAAFADFWIRKIGATPGSNTCSGTSKFHPFVTKAATGINLL